MGNFKNYKLPPQITSMDEPLFGASEHVYRAPNFDEEYYAGAPVIRGQYDIYPEDDPVITPVPEGDKEFQFLDSVIWSDYTFYYIGCDSYEEFVTSSLKNELEFEGIIEPNQNLTLDEMLDKFAIHMLEYDSWEDFESEFNNRSEALESLWPREDYLYYNGMSGWEVAVNDTTKKMYAQIPDELYGKPIISINGTYWGCDSMILAPKIPKYVIDASMAFAYCQKLRIIPILPEGIQFASGIFENTNALFYDGSLEYEFRDGGGLAIRYGFTDYVLPDSLLDINTIDDLF
jgi:hypothetical protein